jgi:peptidoglycan LD-endopeptidase CwlK
MDARSLKVLKTLPPELQKIYVAVNKTMPIVLTDGRRGRIAQTMAYKSGHSKVKFGDSPHNYDPPLACDAYPAPFSSRITVAQMVKLDRVIQQEAKRLNVPIREGVDWDRDGNWTNDRWRDLPHTELHPWRVWAKKSKLFEG